MKQTPILFNTEMVKATLSDIKTQTRRLNNLEEINKNPNEYFLLGFVIRNSDNVWGAYLQKYGCNEHTFIPSAYGGVGDILWVRETFSKNNDRLIYRANVCSKYDLPDGFKWKPSIHMPKETCRIWLQITGIRIERLNQISFQDAIYEGIGRVSDGFSYLYKHYSKQKADNLNFRQFYHHPVSSFKSLWVLINGEQSWESNPWVWVIEFKQIQKP